MVVPCLKVTVPVGVLTPGATTDTVALRSSPTGRPPPMTELNVSAVVVESALTTRVEAVDDDPESFAMPA